MNIYQSPLCSCIICKEVKSAKGIYTHCLMHDPVYYTKHREKALSASKIAVTAVKERKDSKISSEIEAYSLNPSICTHCNSILPFRKRKNKFCNNSCAASYNNKSMTNETKEKISNKLSGRSYPERKPYSKISFCVVCSQCIPNKNIKTCSPECRSIIWSTQATERIKQNRRSNYRRDKKSYLEDSFEKWLNQVAPHINYEPEYTIRNHLTKKWYFVDFYFPDLNLIVELDGKQHDKPKHKESDMIRDSYIVKHLNIQVFRISHTEYQSGTKLEEVKQLLSI